MRRFESGQSERPAVEAAPAGGRSMLWPLLALPALCAILGCQGRNWDNATTLDELVGFGVAGGPHSRWCTVSATLQPGETAPPEVLRREIIKYLEGRPDALVTLIDTDPSGFWSPWRGRDIWACTLARLEGIDLRLYRWDSVEERDRKIAALLKTVAGKGGAEDASAAEAEK